MSESVDQPGFWTVQCTCTSNRSEIFECCLNTARSSSAIIENKLLRNFGAWGTLLGTIRSWASLCTRLSRRISVTNVGATTDLQIITRFDSTTASIGPQVNFQRAPVCSRSLGDATARNTDTNYHAVCEHRRRNIQQSKAARLFDQYGSDCSSQCAPGPATYDKSRPKTISATAPTSKLPTG